jgi:mono/diheme cytochrome c family protein
MMLAQWGAQVGHAAPTDLARGALAVFATKCVQCHGPDVPHPKAGFGFVTDLPRLVESGMYVVPGKPEESEIWKQISDGDMPPDEARAGPLSQAEKDAIVAWIAAGAPIDRPSSASALGTAHDDAMPSDPTQDGPGGSLSIRALDLLGRFHVLVVHFPVAMLVVAALAELWACCRRVQAPLPQVRLCLWIGSVSAVLATGLGWLHALDGFPGPAANPLTIGGLHRWIGTAAGLLAPVVALMVERNSRDRKRTPLTRGAIFGLAAIVGLAGHFGGLLTHGSRFFDP